KSGLSAPLSAVGIDELAGEPVPRERLIAVLREAFSECIGDLPPSEGLTSKESERVRALANEYRWRDSPSESRLIDNSEAVW
ncbi:MAG: hypothetical protein ACRD21_22095, partial [Vicinamibacteria bacterium]